MTLRVDQRTVHFERDDEALAALTARRAAWLAGELALARLLHRIDRCAAFLPAGCGSVEELASRRGYDGPRARDLCQLGYVLAAEPCIEELLRAQEVGFPAACALGRIYRDPLLLDPDDDWVRWARLERLGDLRRRIRRRVESVRQQRPANRTFAANITERTAEKIDRCRHVASQKAGSLLTNGQLLDVVSTGYLLENDDLERAGRPRRLPPTHERPHDRTIPAAVVRALRERSGGLCEFGACERPAQAFCHLVPHRAGSARELEDLVEGCRLHHKAYDAGMIRFVAFTRSTDTLGAGLPVFLAVGTNEILQPKPRPRGGSHATTGGEEPPWLLRALGKRLRRRLLRGLLRAREPERSEDGAPDQASDPGPEAVPAPDPPPKPIPDAVPRRSTRSSRGPPQAQPQAPPRAPPWPRAVPRQESPPGPPPWPRAPQHVHAHAHAYVHAHVHAHALRPTPSLLRCRRWLDRLGP